MTTTGGQVGPYQIVGTLGAGGMGEVFLARDTRLERDVALKMLPAAFARDAERLGRFRREALALASLNHPNIATIHGFETLPDGTMALVLERVEGESLAERLTRGPLALEEAMQVCAQIAEALEVAHERGVVHRDLKPGNVMIGTRGIVKVLDFGLATSARDPAGAEPRRPLAKDSAGMAPGEALARATDGSPLTQAGEAMGTPGYMSPEQALGGVQDARTDVFAFGCVLYECLSGARAFDGESAFEISAALLYAEPDPARLPERTPAGIRALVAQCLQKDPDQRLREIHAARIALEEALGIRRAAALRAGEAVATPSNLPRSLTSFVGREGEIAACEALLGETRLLTLIGVGGCGKTRLALQVAGGRLDAHPDGVWFVDLAPLSDGERVVQAVAAAMGVREEPGRGVVQAVLESVGQRRVMLLLDNCEHLIPAVADLAGRLLQACPQVTLVATSREGLGVPGERLHPVPTLALPGPRVRSAATLKGFESVRLFIERAALVQPAFALTDANAGGVAEICRRLDGIPLAIELAAARAKVLSVDQIQAKLDDRFRLLTGGSRTALPRQQTLRATIQWSHDQLPAEEQALLVRLSVFAGGWTLETATAVTEENADEFDVLDRLTRLVDKSLVVVEHGVADETRYRFLESVRQFALELFAPLPDAGAVRTRHLDRFLALAEASEHHLTGPDQAEWFARLAVEQENLLAGLAFAPQAEDGAERALRLAGSVWRFWSASGHYELGLRALRDALAIPGGQRATAARAQALVRAGGLALYRGDYDAAMPWIEESLALARERGDRKAEARSLSGLGVVATYQGDLAQAGVWTEQARALYQALGEKRGEAVSLHNLGYLAWYRNAPEEALTRFEEALVLLGQVGDREHIALTMIGVGNASVRLGRTTEGRAQLAASLALIRELEARREAAYALEAVAGLELREGRAAEAARTLGAAQGIREAIGSPPVRAEEAELLEFRGKLEAALGAEALAGAEAEGRTLSWEQAVDASLRALEGEPPVRS